MPTPRAHGGAALQQIPFTVPGFMGLNKEAEHTILGPEWATRMQNAVIDETNRVSARKGFSSQTITPLSAGAQFVQIHEYRKKNGNTEIIGTADDDAIYASTDDGQTFSSVTGTATVVDTNVQFINFNDKIIAFQDGGNPMVYSGTSFSDITDSGSQPTGGIGLGAFGRVWAVNSTGVEIQYSGLLDETDWSSADSGVLSMENVWPEGDTITALAAFNGALVIFGKNNIVIMTDGAGSALGLDPLQAYVVDTISGVGCIARDTVQNVKGDLWFLSTTGVQSLGRLVQEKSNPLNNISKNIQDFLISAVTDTAIDLTNARAAYSPKDRFYLLSLPREGNSSDEAGRAFIFDTRRASEDGSVRCIGYWLWLVPVAITVRRNNDILMVQREVPGEVGLYSGYTDDGNTYTFVYESGWIDITDTQGYLIIPKRIEGLFFIGSNVSASLKWAFDFSSIFKSRSLSFGDELGDVSEWGEAEWGEGEWGGTSGLIESKIAPTGSGEYIKLGAQATINGGQFSIQQINIFAKIGRLK